MTKEQVLKKYFGYDRFRPLQAEVIDTILAGKHTLVLMPTGGGKSVCYQVPAMVMEGICVVVSPLIALMKDQVQGLTANGIPAAFLNSSLQGAEQWEIEQACRQGKIKLLYVAPEKLFSGGFMDFVKTLNVNLFAIDESHCVSFWGHDFRPEYTQLGQLRELFPQVPVVALTATADKVTRKDILQQLGIPDAQVFIASFNRPNLSLTVLPGRNRLKYIHDFLKERPNQSGIIYCISRKITESVAEALQKVGYRAKHYHAGMDNAYRSATQDEFIKDDIQIIVATIAFGMGIDKSNVRWIIHYNLPKNIESFYQEIGRAGRDSLPSDTLLFYSYADVMTHQRMNDEAAPERRELLEAKLDRMKQYAEADICRRRILLSYFNETPEQDCGNCDVCQNPRRKFDGTVIAQKALSAVARTQEKIAMGLLVDILRGSHNRQILEKGYDKIKTFGAGKDLKPDEWYDYLFQLVNGGALEVAYDEAHALKLNETSWRVLRQEHTVALVHYEPPIIKKRRQEAEFPREKTKKEQLQEGLFERLRQLRKRLADEQNIPPYVIFGDATLQEMATRHPVNRVGMLSVSGVGQQKFALYGERFLQEIIGFVQEQAGEGHKIKGATYLQTHELYEQGLPLEAIAERRSLSVSTVISHLTKLSRDGYAIDLAQFANLADVETIVKGAKSIGVNPNDALKPLFDYFSEHYDYTQLRLALAIAEQRGDF
jgi:ATP-dependent DNA helicase RecQ